MLGSESFGKRVSRNNKTSFCSAAVGREFQPLSPNTQPRSELFIEFGGNIGFRAEAHQAAYYLPAFEDQ